MRSCTEGKASKNEAIIYLRAAKMLLSAHERGRVVASCWAVDVAASPYRSMATLVSLEGGRRVKPYCQQRKALSETFCPPERGPYGWWGNEFGESKEDRLNGRLLMLCFMAAMVEAGDA